jgi:hypothetical protein
MQSAIAPRLGTQGLEQKMNNQNALWQKAGELKVEQAEILRKMQWQAQSLAIEGKGTAAIDAATASKMARYLELRDEIAATMQAWARA